MYLHQPRQRIPFSIYQSQGKILLFLFYPSRPMLGVCFQRLAQHSEREVLTSIRALLLILKQQLKIN